MRGWAGDIITILRGAHQAVEDGMTCCELFCIWTARSLLIPPPTRIGAAALDSRVGSACAGEGVPAALLAATVSAAAVRPVWSH